MNYSRFCRWCSSRSMGRLWGVVVDWCGEEELLIVVVVSDTG